MNSSSGIKRGLAATAVSALAVAGLPLLATSADAAVGDSFTVTYTGPALNGGTEGAVVIIRALDSTITPADLDLTSTSATASGSQNTGDQTANIVGVPTVSQDDSAAAYEFIKVRIATTTSTTGSAATFRLYEDDAAANNTLDAAEARQSVSISTAGPLASIDIAPMSQSTPENIESGAYTVTLKDSAGRTTQLAPATSITVADEAPVEVTETGPDTAAAGDDAITSQEIARGTDTFTADPATATPGEYDITLTQGAVTKTATLVVTEAASLDAGDIDIVTAADTWNGFGNNPDSDGNPATTYVRVDQNTIRFDFDAGIGDAGANVQLSVNGNGVTFGGQDTATYTTTLDADGIGSITVTVDAATIQEGDAFDVDINGFAQTIVFQRAAADSIDGESAVYFCQDDAACTVTAVVLDQFGNPVTTGEVEARRTGPQNVDATPQRKPVGPDGTVDFTFTDSNPVDGFTDVVRFDYFLDQFDNTSEDNDSSTTIQYSATAQGSDYVISLDGNNTEASGYDASDVMVIPLADTVADHDGGSNESADLGIANGESGSPVTISVDNGALIILAPDENTLSEGSSSVTAPDAGSLPDYEIIGTNSGVVTVTVTSANRTETAQFTVTAETDTTTARNVTVSGPAEVEHGTTQITFMAVVTDAFGNPVVGVPVTDLNIQVTGPAQFQDSDAVSNADGHLHLNVRVDSGAEGVVTIRVQGLPANTQFGAQADRLTAAAATDNGEGLPVSSDIATASTTVKGAVTPPPPPPPPPVRTSIVARLLGHNNGARADKLKVNAPAKAHGAVVKLFKFKNGVRKLVKTSSLNASGDRSFRVADRNGRKFTKYVAVVKRTARTKGDTTNRRSVR